MQTKGSSGRSGRFAILGLLLGVLIIAPRHSQAAEVAPSEPAALKTRERTYQEARRQFADELHEAILAAGADPAAAAVARQQFLEANFSRLLTLNLEQAAILQLKRAASTGLNTAEDPALTELQAKVHNAKTPEKRGKAQAELRAYRELFAADDAAVRAVSK